MAIRRFISLALTATLCGSFTGCAMSGFGWRGPDQAHTLANNSVNPMAPKPSLGSSLASGMKSTTNKVSDAFTIKEKVEQADDPIKITSKNQPVGAEVYISAARLYENRSEFEAAAGQYRKALEVSPENQAALLGYARLQDRQNKFDEASKLYKKAIAAHPKSATAHNDLGLCQARHGQPETALESLQKAVSLDPTNKLYRNNIASILVDIDRGQDAYEHLVLAHGEAIAHYNLGYLLFQRDKLEPASRQFSLAFEKDPSLVQAKDMLERTGGVAQNQELVQRTQHVSAAPPAKSGELQVSEAVPTNTLEKFPHTATPNLNRPSANILLPRKTQAASVKPAKASIARALLERSAASEEVSAEEMPQHVFPPIRLPATDTTTESEQDLPAPLPDDSEFAPSLSDVPRALPRVEDE